MASDQSAGAPDDRAALLLLNDDYVRSVFTSDTARFDQILADDFRNTNPDGTIVDRAAFLVQIARPANLKNLSCQDVEIRLFGDTAIVHARTVYETSDGRPGAGRYTDVWHKENGQWRAIAAHVTRLVLALVLLAAWARPAAAEQLPSATPESVGLSSERLARLARVIRADVDRGRMPGAVVAIARKGKLVYHEAFGFSDAAARTPMPKDAIFALASMTKPLAAVATLMLFEQGDLLLNDPVSNYLPALKGMKVATPTGLVAARREPTLQDMLRHTAGVSYGNRGDTPLHKLYETTIKSAATQSGDEFLKALGSLPLHYQPGTQWEYSHGLDVAGLAVETVTKQRLGEFLQQRVFTPLGMVDTAFTQPAAKASRIARPLATDPDTGRPTTFRVPTTPWLYDCGGGCASATALDYLRFAQMLLDRGSFGGTRILSRKTVEYMTANQLGADVDVSRLNEFAVEHMDGFGFGLGVAVRVQPGVAGVPGTPGEFLWSGAQGTMFWVDPKEELAVVFLANTPGPVRRHYRELVKTLVVQAIND